MTSFRCVGTIKSGTSPPKTHNDYLVITALSVSSTDSGSMLCTTPRPAYSRHCCLHWSPQSGCDGYLSVGFHVAVIDAMLYLSGDVETNPGPLCEFTFKC